MAALPCILGHQHFQTPDLSLSASPSSFFRLLCSPASSAPASCRLETEPMELCAYREPAVPRRKRALGTREAFDLKKVEVLGGGKMSDPERKNLRQRFHSELVTVRGLLEKAVAALSSSSPSAPRGKDSQRFLAAEPPAKRRKASPLLVVEHTDAPKNMAPAEREQLAADLAELSAELPAHILELLQKQSHVCRGGEIEIDIHAMEGAAMLELKKQVDKFAEERNHGHEAIDVSGDVIHGRSPQRRQDVKIVEEEEEEDIDIVGGVSPLVTAPSPLQLAEEEEEDEFVDVCGDASPVVMPQNIEDGISCSPSSSSNSGSDSDSSSSGSDCSSDSDSHSDSDESLSSPAPAEHAATPPRTELIAHVMESPERQRKEERSRAREKARQELLEMERTAMGSESIHPIVLERLGIAKVQYMVSPASFLQRLGLFLKADDDDGEEDSEEGDILM